MIEVLEKLNRCVEIEMVESTNHGSRRRALEDWLRFVVAETHVLKQDPDLIWQQAANQPRMSAVSEHVEKFQRAGWFAHRPWLSWINRPIQIPSQIMLLEGSTQGSVVGVKVVAVSHDGRRIVTAGRESLTVWDGITGSAVYTIDEPGHEITGMAVTPDGSRIISAAHDNTIRIWDLEDGRELRRIKLDCKAFALAITADGQQFISSNSDGTIGVWEVATGNRLHKLKGLRQYKADFAVTLTPDGSRIVSGGSNNTVIVWDLRSGQPSLVLRGHSGSVNSVTVMSDNRRVVSGSFDGSVKVWDIDSGRTLQTFKIEGAGPFRHDYRVWTVVATEDGRHILSGGTGDGTLRIWDVGAGKPKSSIAVFDSNSIVKTIAITADGKRLLCGGTRPYLKVFDLERLLESHASPGHSDSVEALAISGDGSRVVSGGRDGEVRVWDIDTGRELYTLKGESTETRVFDGADQQEMNKAFYAWDRKGIEAVLVTPDSKRVVCATLDGTVRQFDLKNPGRPRYLRRAKRRRYYALELMNTVEGQRLVLGETSLDYRESWLRIWDLETGHKLFTRRMPGEFSKIIATPDGRRLMVFRALGGVDILEMAGGQKLKKFEAASDEWPHLIMPDSRRLVSIEDHALKIKDIASGRELGTLVSPDAVETAAISPDGRIFTQGRALVTGWDAKSFRELSRFPGRILDPIASRYAITSDGAYIVGEASGKIGVFDAEFGRLLARFPLPALPSCVVAQDDIIAAADIAGGVYILRLCGATVGPRIITVEVIEGHQSFFCPYCKARTDSGSSDLGREVACPQCRRSLKLNPFAIDLGTRRGVARPWQRAALKVLKQAAILLLLAVILFSALEGWRMVQESLWYLLLAAPLFALLIFFIVLRRKFIADNRDRF